MSEESPDHDQPPAETRSEVERQSSVKGALELFRYIKPYSRWFWPAMVAE